MNIQLPIEPEKLESKTLMDRFWGSDPAQNYFARAKNLVIQGQLDPKLYATIEQEYGHSIADEFRTEWLNLLEEITYYIAIDGVIDADEKAFFKAYIALFNIDAEAAKSSYRKGASRALGQIMRRMMGDMKLDDKEAARLEAIAKSFGLSELDFDPGKELGEIVKPIIQARFDEITRDLAISDAEWEDFQNLCRDLRVDFRVPEEGKRAIELGRAIWRKRFGPLDPIIVPDVKLAKGEDAYLKGKANWYEERKEKGIAYKARIRSGTVVLTNKRVVMIADEGDNKTLDWTKIHRVNYETPRCFELERVTGKSPVIDIHRADDHTLLSASYVASRLCRGAF